MAHEFFSSTARRSLLAGPEGRLLGASLTGLEEAGDPADIIDRGDTVLDLGRDIGSGMLESMKSGATFAGDVFAGRDSPENVGRVLDTMGIMATGGLLAPRNSLGVLGSRFVGKPRTVVDPKDLQDKLSREFRTINSRAKLRGVNDPDRALEDVLTLKIDEFNFGDISGRTLFVYKPVLNKSGKGNTLTMDVVFSTDLNRNPMNIPSVVDLKSRSQILTHVFDSLDQVIKQSRPEFVTFNASKSKLRALYTRASNELARKHNGTVLKASGPLDADPGFKIQLPNPRFYAVQ